MCDIRPSSAAVLLGYRQCGRNAHRHNSLLHVLVVCCSITKLAGTQRCCLTDQIRTVTCFIVNQFGGNGKLCSEQCGPQARTTASPACYASSRFKPSHDTRCVLGSRSLVSDPSDVWSLAGYTATSGRALYDTATCAAGGWPYRVVRWRGSRPAARMSASILSGGSSWPCSAPAQASGSQRRVMNETTTQCRLRHEPPSSKLTTAGGAEPRSTV